MAVFDFDTIRDFIQKMPMTTVSAPLNSSSSPEATYLSRNAIGWIIILPVVICENIICLMSISIRYKWKSPDVLYFAIILNNCFTLLIPTGMYSVFSLFEREWTLRSCKFILWCVMSSRIINSLQLSFLSLDRVWTLKWPGSYSTHNTTHKNAKTVVFMWMFGFTIATVPLFGWTDATDQVLVCSLILDVAGSGYALCIVILLMGSHIVSLACVIAMIMKLSFTRNILELDIDIKQSSPEFVIDSYPGNCGYGIQEPRDTQNREICILVAWVVILDIFVSGLPFSILNVVAIVAEQPYGWIQSTITWTVIFYCAFVPILLGLVCGRYRRSYKKFHRRIGEKLGFIEPPPEIINRGILRQETVDSLDSFKPDDEDSFNFAFPTDLFPTANSHNSPVKTLGELVQAHLREERNKAQTSKTEPLHVVSDHSYGKNEAIKILTKTSQGSFSRQEKSNIFQDIGRTQNNKLNGSLATGEKTEEMGISSRIKRDRSFDKKGNSSSHFHNNSNKKTYLQDGVISHKHENAHDETENNISDNKMIPPKRSSPSPKVPNKSGAIPKSTKSVKQSVKKSGSPTNDLHDCESHENEHIVIPKKSFKKPKVSKQHSTETSKKHIQENVISTDLDTARKDEELRSTLNNSISANNLYAIPEEVCEEVLEKIVSGSGHKRDLSNHRGCSNERNDNQRSETEEEEENIRDQRRKRRYKKRRSRDHKRTEVKNHLNYEQNRQLEVEQDVCDNNPNTNKISTDKIEKFEYSNAHETSTDDNLSTRHPLNLESTDSTQYEILNEANKPALVQKERPPIGSFSKDETASKTMDDKSDHASKLEYDAPISFINNLHSPSFQLRNESAAQILDLSKKYSLENLKSYSPEDCMSHDEDTFAFVGSSEPFLSFDSQIGEEPITTMDVEKEICSNHKVNDSNSVSSRVESKSKRVSAKEMRENFRKSKPSKILFEKDEDGEVVFM